MLGLPKSTEFDKRIPKQKFYERVDLPPKLKKAFQDQIKIIYWRNKISATTMNLEKSNDVLEIQVIEIKLLTPDIDENILKRLDKDIPYHIVFVLTYENNHKLCIGYKAISAKGTTSNIKKYYYTDWDVKENFSFKLDGLSVNSVYKGIFLQVAGKNLRSIEHCNLKELIEKNIEIDKIEKKIKQLETKRNREQQLNKQFKINDEIKRLANELLSYTSE
ncbi:MAG: hypothetical protein ATN34_02445 [Epulopiscium sp. Nele67-Bin002]|nr:MAG: hypothetical protein ATN33_01745 [Epulopiscium sp. Nele67-Bin001]OON92621.1 MAG: hypothetical protein ATN34_02445 [Epulopiscium sp. Nele67-Bin002]